jgi:hypothetical protein
MNDAVTVRLEVTWASMMMGKLRGAMRPTRLLLMGLVVVALGTVLATEQQVPLSSGIASVFTFLLAVRFTVMALSSALDGWARRYDGARLTVAPTGLSLAFADGKTESHPWTWVLSVKRDGQGHALQTQDRGGRAWLFLSGNTLTADERNRLSELLTRRG